jgi:hypothetical protein
MTDTSEELIRDYLERLENELADLPRARRREIFEEISDHIEEARASGAADELSTRSLLERLGDPADIAADARERFDVRPARAGFLEIAALVLLLIGGLVLPIVGWFVGVLLLWASAVWTTRDKLLGTLLLPGGLALPFLLAVGAIGGTTETCSGTGDQILSTGETIPGTEVCTGGPSQAMEILGPILLVALIIAPVATSIYLAQRMRRRPA